MSKETTETVREKKKRLTELLNKSIDLLRTMTLKNFEYRIERNTKEKQTSGMWRELELDNNLQIYISISLEKER